MSYERVVGRGLESLVRPGDSLLVGPWFKYEDASGLGWCQPDFILVRGGRALVIEAKLKFRHGVFEELTQLYIPVVSAAIAPKDVLAALVVKNVSPGCPQPARVDGFEFPVLDPSTTARRPSVAPPVYLWRDPEPLMPWSTGRALESA